MPTQLLDLTAPITDEERARWSRLVPTVPAIAPGAGVGLLDRAALSFASTPAGEENILRQRGFNPTRGPRGDLFVDANGIRQRVDPQGLELGDLADVAGEVPSTLLSILGGIGAGAAGLVSGPGALAAGAAGAGVGSALGNVAKQKIGQSLGSGQSFSPREVAIEGAVGAAGEGVGRLALKGLAPLSSAVTKRVRQGVLAPGQALDEKFGTETVKRLPASARTDSRFVGQMEQGVRESALGGQGFDEQVTAPFQREAQTLFNRIGNRASGGQLGQGGTRTSVGEGLSQAREVAIERQREAVDAAYDQVRQLVDPALPVEPTQTLSRVEELAQRIAPLKGFEVAQPRTEGIGVLQDAVNKIRTFDQLDAFRRLVGSELRSGPNAQLARHGLEAETAGLYRALAGDLEAALRQAGEATGSDLPAVAAKARGLAQDQLAIDQSPTIRNAFSDPDRIEAFVGQLAGKTGAQIRRLKEGLGVLSSTNGLPATEEGLKAWQQVQGELLDEVLDRSFTGNVANQVPILSGARMLTQLEKINRSGALTELFGRESADDLLTFARYLRDTNIAERQFGNFSGTASASEMRSFIKKLFVSPVSLAAEVGSQLGASKLVRSPTGRRLLTEGFGQNNTLIQALGRLGGQGVARGTDRLIGGP